MAEMLFCPINTKSENQPNNIFLQFSSYFILSLLFVTYMISDSDSPSPVETPVAPPEPEPEPVPKCRLCVCVTLVLFLSTKLVHSPPTFLQSPHFTDTISTSPSNEPGSTLRVKLQNDSFTCPLLHSSLIQDHSSFKQDEAA